MLPDDELDRRLAALHSRRQDWADLPVEGKLPYAESLHRGLHRVAAGQVAAALEAKSIRPGSVVAAEEWMSGPVINLRTTRLLIQSLRQLRDRGAIDLPLDALRRRGDDQLAVPVFPIGLLDRLLFRGIEAEVWMPPGVDQEELVARTGAGYLDGPRTGRVALVLGAGNVASIGALDAVTKLFLEHRVVLLKLNPVNAYLEPFLEDAFSDLIADGFLDICRGGAAEGDYLAHHPQVDEIHITGSAHTHDVIVWGSGEEGERRRAAGEPRLRKRITSELGNVSPMIVTPGPWSEADLAYHAEYLATQMAHNAGFNCNATKVIVTPADWPLRRALLDRLGEALAALPDRVAYYPGAEERWERFVSRYPEARTFGRRSEGRLPVALVEGVEPDHDGPAFEEESFCTFTVEVPISGADPASYLRRAVQLCNDRLYGTLNAGMVIHPATRRELGPALEEAITGLRYGTIAINHWPALGYALGCLPWGAFPGHTLDDIQSGIGVVHNTWMIGGVERSIVDGPFRSFPKPPWFLGHRGGPVVARQLAEVEYDGGLRHLPKLFLHALRG